MQRIPIKTNQEIDTLRESARLLVDVFQAVEALIRPGVKTQDLNDCAADVIRRGGGEPAFRGYNGYPADICVSIDDQVVHGIPGPRIMREGELVSVDIGVKRDGFYADATKTCAVGSVDEQKENLLRATREALACGIRQCRKGYRVSDISHAIQHYVESKGYSVVRSLVGHGIGRALHEEPQIPNYGPPHRGSLLEPGMVFAIEPMVNLGTHRVRTSEDGWTVHTEDGLPSAHFEHTVLITEGKPEILTAGIDNNGGL